MEKRAPSHALIDRSPQEDRRQGDLPVARRIINRRDDGRVVRRLEALMARQKEIQIARYKKYIGTILEVMVEGKNEARKQWIGRTSQNKVFNFTAPADIKLSPGEYVTVLTTGSFPNSLLGELVV